MRPTPAPRSPSAHFDDLPDLAFDAPSAADFAADVFPDTSVDALPEELPEARPRGRKTAASKNRLLEAPVAAPGPAPAASGPTSVCLSCGASPPDSGDCPHDEVAHLTDAPAAVMAIVRKLQAAVQERHAQERALRRLVAAEVASGRGDLETPNRPGAPIQPPTERDPSACARCGHRPTLSRSARRKALTEAQATFFFATPPAVEVTPVVDTPSDPPAA